MAGDDCGLAAGGVGHDPAHHAPLPTDEDAMILRQSTAVTVEVGPFLDSTDGSTAETGLTITQPDIRLSKNGGSFAQKSAAGTATHMENGYYSVSLSTTDTNTVGRLRLHVNKSGALPVWMDFQVVEEAVYDALFASGAVGPLLANSTGSGLSAIPWNSAWDAEVQSECADALNAYDPPTNAEMEARTLAAASYATASALQTVDDAVDAIKAVTDNLPDGGALSSLATASALQTVDYVVDAIKAVTDNLPDGGALSSLATASALSTVDSVVDAIKVTTDKLDDTLELDNTVYRFTANALEQAPSGGASAADIADAVWEEVLADHSGTAGSAAEQLAAAGAAGDPWATALPGSYTEGQAGKIVSTVGTVVDAIKAVTDNLPDGGALSSLATASALSTVDNVVDAIKAVTDNLPDSGALSSLATAAELAKVPKSDGTATWNATAAAQIQSKAADALTAYDPPTKDELDSGLAGLNIPTAAAIADAVLDEALSGHTTAGSLGKAVADIKSDTAAILEDTGT